MNIENSIVIHQPNFLPWLGYFAKLIYAEKLIVLDNVQFSKRKHIDRVQITNSLGEIFWIGLSVGQNYKIPCNKIYYNNQLELDRLTKTLYFSYSKSKYFNMYFGFFENIFQNCLGHSNILSEIDLYIIEEILKLLDINHIQIIRSSEFIESKFFEPTDRLIYLCEKTKSNQIIVGSKEATDVHNINKLRRNGVALLLQDYWNNHPTYHQTRRSKLGFAKGLSVVDAIFNIGVEETKKLLYLNPRKYE